MTTAADTLSDAELLRRLREVEPAACLVTPRVLRRLFRVVHGLASTGLRTPHHKSLVISAAVASSEATFEELGNPPTVPSDGDLVLLMRPEPRRLATLPAGEVLRSYWRLLFHARLHRELRDLVLGGGLDRGEVRTRARAIGEAAFDEARDVLRREQLLFDPADDRAAYIEFAVVFLELKQFAPGLIRDYFPALVTPEAASSTFLADVDPEAIARSTKPRDASEPEPVLPTASDEEAEDLEVGSSSSDGDDWHDSASASPRLLKRADRAEAAGNDVRAAIFRERYARGQTPARAGQVRSAARSSIERVARRLVAAIEAEPSEVAAWSAALVPLLKPASRGAWPVAARLLYDLQRVGVAHEREVYRIDLPEWVLSLGRRSLKRRLPNQREVSEALLLRRAARRLNRVKLDERSRRELQALFRHANERAEARLRERFRPLISRALELADLQPKNLPERVAFRKVVEELLDELVKKGHLAAGDLRDALSRNALKLPDLRPKALWRGDRLLRADHRLGFSLEGVYRRAEVYVRGLQKASSLAFGTPVGRLVTKFAILPFGGAFVILEGLKHLIEPLVHSLVSSRAEIELVSPVTILLFGVFLLGMMHVGRFRRFVGATSRAIGNGLRAVFVTLPIRVANLPAIRSLMASPPAAFLWHWLVAPGAIAALAALATLLADGDIGTAWMVAAGAFVVAAGLLNSRVGRRIEEEVVEQVQAGWTHLMGELLPGLYRGIMRFFDKVLEIIDRVLYTVDEWLRFRSGESGATLAAKAVVGLLWAAVAYVVRFLVVLMVEPQVNPIKHFPVVTVAHKVLLPFMLAVPAILTAAPYHLNPDLAKGIAAGLQFLLPGVFGFLVWELKENWRLYEANRPNQLKPALIGHHGETMTRLLRPGFHSGTLPKLFDRLRRSARGGTRGGPLRASHRRREEIHHVELAALHFVERELIDYLKECPDCLGMDVEAGAVEAGTNRLAIATAPRDRPGSPWWLIFEEHSGWLVAGGSPPGWTAELDPEARARFALAVAGLYKRAGVELLREQVEAALEPPESDFDVIAAGIRAWDRREPEATSTFPLRDLSDPSVPRSADAPALDLTLLRFGREPIEWTYWVDAWGRAEAGEVLPELPTGPVLPLHEAAESVEARGSAVEIPARGRRR